MAIDKFLDKTITLQRKMSRTSKSVEDWNDISNDLRCCIYPINASDAIAFQNVNFQTNITHKMICGSSHYTVIADILYFPEDIEIDDKVIDGDNEYLIKKINSWDKFFEIYLSEVT